VTLALDRPYAGARTSSSLSRRWFAEGLYGKALITHLEDLQVLRLARGVKDHAIAYSGLHERTGQWRQPADVVAIQIDLVGAFLRSRERDTPRFR